MTFAQFAAWYKKGIVFATGVVGLLVSTGFLSGDQELLVNAVIGAITTILGILVKNVVPPSKIAASLRR